MNITCQNALLFSLVNQICIVFSVLNKDWLKNIYMVLSFSSQIKESTSLAYLAERYLDREILPAEIWQHRLFLIIVNLASSSK